MNHIALFGLATLSPAVAAGIADVFACDYELTDATGFDAFLRPAQVDARHGQGSAGRMIGR